MPPKIVVIISANAEWQVFCPLFPQARRQESPLGEWFEAIVDAGGRTQPVVFFHGGWGKIAAAASAQYAIDRWQPDLLVNLGTCGGFAGEVEQGEILLVERTLAYDIIEQMSDPDQALAHYTTELDLDWLKEPYPLPVRRTLLVSGDRDLLVEDIPMLKARFGAVAGDWESASIAWVARRSGVRCLILRGVSDLVHAGGDETYGNLPAFVEGARGVMRRLAEALPGFLIFD